MTKNLENKYITQKLLIVVAVLLHDCIQKTKIDLNFWF